MKLKKAALFTLLFITFSGFVGVTWAEEYDDSDFTTGAKPSDFVKERSYIGVGGISGNIDNGNDFNGTKGVTFSGTSSTELDLIPAINRNFGFGVIVGRREGAWAMEATYWRSDHTATWTGGAATTFTTPATLQSFDIDIKRYLLTQLPTQPFINFGVCFPWLWVSNGSDVLDTNNNVIGANDLTISGIGFDVGAGMEVYLDEHMSLVGSVRERWTEFNQVNGAFKVGENSINFSGNSNSVGAFAGNGLEFFVGTTVGFQ